MCIGFFYHITVATLVYHVISVAGITNAKENDALNLNRLGNDDQYKGNVEKHKDDVGRETQENRAFVKPEFDRRGSFYPSGHEFSVGTSLNVGGTSPSTIDERNFHISGNGYSYGAPTLSYPPVIYGSGFLSSHGPPGGSYGPPGGSYGPPGGSYGPPGGSYGPPGGSYGPPGGSYGPPGGSYGPSGGSYGPPSFPSGGFGSGFGGVGHGVGHGGIGGGGHGAVGHSVGGYGGGGGHNQALALKGLLIPIAGVALLGAAAAFAKSHPVLLQLGVISGKRKRSVAPTHYYPENPYVRPDENQLVY